MKCKYVIPVAMLFFFLAVPAANLSKAESPGTGGQTPANADHAAPLSTEREIWQTIEALREVRLLKELALSPDRARQILEKVHAAQKIKQRYLVQRVQLETTLDTLLAFSPADQPRLSVVLKELEALKLHYYQLALTADHELWTLLSPEEQAKYVLFQKNFNKQLRELIANIRQQRGEPTPKQNFLLRRQEGESVIRAPRE